MKLYIAPFVLLGTLCASCSDGRPVRSRSFGDVEALNPKEEARTRSQDSRPQTAGTATEKQEEAIFTDPEIRETDEPDTDQTLALQGELDAAQAKLQTLEKALQEKSAQVGTIAELNQEFCSLYLKQTKSCLALSKLIPSTEFDETKCIENGSTEQSQLHSEMTVELRLGNAAPGAEFELVANDAFVSSPFTSSIPSSGASTGTAGKVSKLTWKAEASSNKTSVPALFEIKKLALRARGGQALPVVSPNDKTFVLKVGKQIVLNSEDLIPWTNGEFKAVVNTIPLLDLVNFPECSVTEQDLADLARSVRSRTEQKKSGDSL